MTLRIGMYHYSYSKNGWRIDPHQSRPPELIARRPKTENFLAYLLEIVGGKQRKLCGKSWKQIVFDVMFENNRQFVVHAPAYSASCYCY